MKVRGFQVAPAELEGHLLMHPDVVDACVVSIPDAYSGELPLAYIVLSELASRRLNGNAHAAGQLKTVLAKVIRIYTCTIPVANEIRVACCGCKSSLQAISGWS